MRLKSWGIDNQLLAMLFIIIWDVLINSYSGIKLCKRADKVERLKGNQTEVAILKCEVLFLRI